MKLSHYDYLVVGAGISSAVFCHEAAKLGKACLVIDRRDHIAGNIYTEDVQGINVHRYGAHIFHTSTAPSLGLRQPLRRVQQLREQPRGRL